MLDYTGKIQKVGSLEVGDQNRQTHIRFRNFADYEANINDTDQDFESEDSIFNRYNLKIDTPQFNLVRQGDFGSGCDFKLQSIENEGNNCYVPSIGYCFIKCINYLTNSDYKEQYLDFIRNEQKQSNIMTMARMQPCLRKLGVNLGY